MLLWPKKSPVEFDEELPLVRPEKDPLLAPFLLPPALEVGPDCPRNEQGAKRPREGVTTREEDDVVVVVIVVVVDVVDEDGVESDAIEKKRNF